MTAANDTITLDVEQYAARSAPFPVRSALADPDLVWGHAAPALAAAFDAARRAGAQVIHARGVHVAIAWDIQQAEAVAVATVYGVVLP